MVRRATTSRDTCLQPGLQSFPVECDAGSHLGTLDYVEIPVVGHISARDLGVFIEFDVFLDLMGVGNKVFFFERICCRYEYLESVSHETI